MFLNLICDYMNKQQTPDFPRHIHVVFEEYIQKRLMRDQERLLKKFNTDIAEVRIAAEKLAFCMTADRGLGLGPKLQATQRCRIKTRTYLGERYETLIGALEYLKLARIEENIADGYRTFTFAHRRFQEYFATTVVLREPERVNTF